MQLLFQNNVPMCIEVILCCDCPCGVQRAQSAEVGYAPSASDLLLEQWAITYNNRYSWGDGSILVVKFAQRPKSNFCFILFLPGLVMLLQCFLEALSKQSDRNFISPSCQPGGAALKAPVPLTYATG